jgi:hypothetical protein
LLSRFQHGSYYCWFRRCGANPRSPERGGVQYFLWPTYLLSRAAVTSITGQSRLSGLAITQETDGRNELSQIDQHYGTGNLAILEITIAQHKLKSRHAAKSWLSWTIINRR